MSLRCRRRRRGAGDEDPGSTRAPPRPAHGQERSLEGQARLRALCTLIQHSFAVQRAEPTSLTSSRPPPSLPSQPGPRSSSPWQVPVRRSPRAGRPSRRASSSPSSSSVRPSEPLLPPLLLLLFVVTTADSRSRFHGSQVSRARVARPLSTRCARRPSSRTRRPSRPRWLTSRTASRSTRSTSVCLLPLTLEPPATRR